MMNFFARFSCFFIHRDVLTLCAYFVSLVAHNFSVSDVRNIFLIVCYVNLSSFAHNLYVLRFREYFFDSEDKIKLYYNFRVTFWNLSNY